MDPSSYQSASLLSNCGNSSVIRVMLRLIRVKDDLAMLAITGESYIHAAFFSRNDGRFALDGPFHYPSIIIITVVNLTLPASIMVKHRPDLIMCRKQPGIAIGGYARKMTESRCVRCGGAGISDAYHCKECTQQEKDRDGCPKIVNLGSAKTDLFYEHKKYGFKKR
ncbi:PHD finger-like domain-containing protein [Drosera capensis]